MCGIEQGPSFTDPFVVRKVVDPPTLSLLTRKESTVRSFAENLIFCLRSQPRPVVGYRPGTLWRNVFIPSGVPWRWFGRSLIGHAIMIAFLVTVLRPSKVTARRPEMAANSQITYYLKPPTFPAREARPSASSSRRSSTRTGVRAQAALRVAPGRRSAALTAPQVRLPRATNNGIAAFGNHLVAPAPPSSALSQFHLKAAPGSQVAAVAPVPSMQGLRSSASGMTIGNSTVVAPAPQVAGIGRTPFGKAGAPGLGGSGDIVAPAPQVAGIGRTPYGKSGAPGLGGSGDIVAPAPQVAGIGRTPYGKGAPGLGGSGDIVAPAPQVAGIGRTPYGKSGAPGLGGSGDIVAPAPQVAGIGRTPFGKSGASGFGGSGDIVGPVPQIGGAVSGRGGVLPQSDVVGPAPGSGDFDRGFAKSGTGNFGVGYVPAVPPAPQVSGLGGGSGGGTGGSTIGSPAASVVAPPPSLQGSGMSGEGGVGATSPGGGLQVAAAPPIQQQEIDSSERKSAGEIPEPELTDNTPPGSVQEFSLHLVGVASALPNSSYFSNYEVFIAERRLTTLKSQLIKLVYMFLPYQRRLSQYGTANLRTLKLRVRRDPSCDESLLDITWPDAASRRQAADANPEKSAAKLPCYRTSADDYRRALAKIRE